MRAKRQRVAATRRSFLFGLLLSLGILPLANCSANQPETETPSASPAKTEVLTIGAIPDQDPEILNRLNGKLADYLSQELGVKVVYKPVTDYAAAVTAFRVGDLDLVWFGGLTGVQARLQVPGAEAIVQRDVDPKFHSVFIANRSANLQPLQDAKELTQLKGKTLTFGSESSTSGRLMPQYFLQQAGIKLSDFKGEVGFSQSHDATIKLVEAGTYEVGALNEKVWVKRVQEKQVDQSKVTVIWRTPAYYDYHWVINPQVKQRFGNDFADQVKNALLKLDPKVPEQKEILDLYTAGQFIPTQNSNYAQIEAIGREIGKIK